MKKILIGLTLLASMSSFAGTQMVECISHDSTIYDQQQQRRQILTQPLFSGIDLEDGTIVYRSIKLSEKKLRAIAQKEAKENKYSFLGCSTKNYL